MPRTKRSIRDYPFLSKQEFNDICDSFLKLQERHVRSTGRGYYGDVRSGGIWQLRQTTLPWVGMYPPPQRNLCSDRHRAKVSPHISSSGGDARLLLVPLAAEHQQKEQ